MKEGQHKQVLYKLEDLSVSIDEEEWGTNSDEQQLKVCMQEVCWPIKQGQTMQETHRDETLSKVMDANICMLVDTSKIED